MWWPLSARLADAFLKHGFPVASACHRGHPLRAVDGLARHYDYGGPNSLETLAAAIARARPRLVVPCDDGAVWQLHHLHPGAAPELRRLLEHSLGPPETYPILRSRSRLLAIAAELGIRVPATRSVSRDADLSATCPAAPVVLKVDGTCGGNGVQIARTPAEAETALRGLARPVSRLTAWKQLLVDRDPLPWSWCREHHVPAVTLQQYIAGRPANAMLACWKGELLAMVTVEVLAAHGATGAATVVRIVEIPEVRRAARRLTERLQLTGFHGLDFILEQETGAPYLIELNPRATQLGHLRLPGQGDLAGVLGAALEGRPAGTDLPGEPIPGDIVAFFPQAASVNPDSPYLLSGYHDVPFDQPALHRLLLGPSWRDRRLLARLYHLVRPRGVQREVEFESATRLEGVSAGASSAATH